MNLYTVSLPLAQLNTTIGGAGATTTTGAAVERPATPATGTTTTTTTATGTAPAPAQQPGSIWGSLLPIVLMFVVLYFFLFRGQRKTEKKRKEMINELKKGDRVMTIGGMIARVVSIEGDEVVLKIDESANVKATYSKKSIQEVLDRDERK